MLINTEPTAINMGTKHIRNFETVEVLENEQHLLGVGDLETGNGIKVSLENIITSSISSDENNSIIKGTDGKLYSEDKTGDLSNLETHSKENIVNALNGLQEQVDILSFDGILNKITNSFLEVPQRIKIELVNGVLTLKAGSQVTIPDGFEADGTTPKFYYHTIENDITFSGAGTSVAYDRFVSINTQGTEHITTFNGWSGTSDYTEMGNCILYRSDLNKVKCWYSGSPVEGVFSLPICRVLSNENYLYGKLTHVFNGFGYIGLANWLDKDVKILIPDGLNENGTLKNIIHTVSKVIITTTTSLTANGYIDFDIVSGEKLYEYWENAVFVQEEEPTNLETVLPYSAVVWYQPSKNIWWYIPLHSAAPYNWIIGKGTLFGRIFKDGTRIISKSQPLSTTDLVTRNDFKTIAGLGYPSDRKIELTLGASGTDYVAPANGWFILQTYASAVGNGVALTTSSTIDDKAVAGFRSYASAVGQYPLVCLPVSKGQKVRAAYIKSTDYYYFAFTYAEGEI